LAFLSVHHHSPFSMAHHRRRIGGVCAPRRARGPLLPRNVNERPPAQKVDLMKTVYPHEDSDSKSITLSIVPEVDEEEEEEPESPPLTVFLQPEEPPKTLKRKRSLVELVLDVAFLMRRKVKGKVLSIQSQDRPSHS